MESYRVPPKLDLKPKRHHGYAVFLFILGTLFPPLAVAARFGIGKDFWINLFLTICGYIPGHVHNFYIQNIRNNKSHARTPKWAQRYGLVDTAAIKRKEQRSQWANRYKDRLPNSTLEQQPLEDGQRSQTSLDNSSEGQPANSGLWSQNDEQFYSESNGTSSGRWRYPANFDDAVAESRLSKKSKKKEKKDRWARTEDAYSQSEETSRKKKSKRKKKTKSLESSDSKDSVDGYPEDPEGGLYGRQSDPAINKLNSQEVTDVFNHDL